jgi:limonene-1,2-epoxide hydrolase
MATNEQIVSDFLEAWGRLDVEELVGFFTEDAVYHNIPVRPAVGKAAIRKVITALLKGVTAIRFEVHYQASAGNVVINERTDHTEMGDKKFPLPVSGVFEIENGKIKAWRDYFDLAMFNSAMAG